MSESTAAATDLTSHYTAQVASDLERNLKEQERISGDIAALQQQLAALQHDHAVLLSMQQALGTAPAPVTPAAPPEEEAPAGSATVPAPRGKRAAKEAAEQPKRGKRSTSAARRAPGRGNSGKAAGWAPAGKAPARAAGGAKGTQEGPKLVDLVRGHLAEQGEPRSATEIAEALGAAHPGRAVKTTVVRSTLEGLVARNRAQRTKQGTSVFYSAPDATAPDAREDDASAS